MKLNNIDFDKLSDNELKGLCLKYKLVDNNCLCKTHNDVLLSLSDRHCVDFLTVVCKNCGLIRAKNYFRERNYCFKK